MRQYIVNLTDHLIRKNGYDKVRLKGKRFITHVSLDLETGDVSLMSPRTLGKIMCSLEIGDVMVGKTELFESLHFSGDPEMMLRELVSFCLAYVIRDRLSGDADAHTI